MIHVRVRDRQAGGDTLQLLAYGGVGDARQRQVFEEPLDVIAGMAVDHRCLRAAQLLHESNKARQLRVGEDQRFKVIAVDLRAGNGAEDRPETADGPLLRPCVLPIPLPPPFRSGQASAPQASAAATVVSLADGSSGGSIHPALTRAVMLADLEEGPGDIVSPVACEEEEPARFQETMDMSEIGPVDEPTLVMARLRPGIGVKKIDAFETGAGQGFEEVARVAVMNRTV